MSLPALHFRSRTYLLISLAAQKALPFGDRGLTYGPRSAVHSPQSTVHSLQRDAGSDWSSESKVLSLESMHR
jgi:hypothetical protein